MDLPSPTNYPHSLAIQQAWLPAKSRKPTTIDQGVGEEEWVSSRMSSQTGGPISVRWADRWAHFRQVGRQVGPFSHVELLDHTCAFTLKDPVQVQYYDAHLRMPSRICEQVFLDHSCGNQHCALSQSAITAQHLRERRTSEGMVPSKGSVMLVS